MRLPWPRLQPQRTLSVAQARALIAATGSVRNRAAILLLVTTGLRVGELACMEVADVDFGEGTIRVHGKGGRIRYVGVPELTLAELRRYVGTRIGAVWLRDTSPWTPLSPRSAPYMVRAASRRAGIVANPHALRRAFATEFIVETGDPVALQAVLGHTTLTMSLQYVRAAAQQRALAQQRRTALAQRVAG